MITIPNPRRIAAINFSKRSVNFIMVSFYPVYLSSSLSATQSPIVIFMQGQVRFSACPKKLIAWRIVLIVAITLQNSGILLHPCLFEAYNYLLSSFTLSHNLSQSGLRTISVLRFFALPSLVELSATGLNFPFPAAVSRAGSIW